MNKYDEIDAVYPPYTKEIQLLAEKSVQLPKDSIKEAVLTVEKSDSAGNQ